MKVNYSKKLIFDYINGEYIENIDELENNYLFMIEVIKYSKDKNFYHLCSDIVKNNFIFVKFLIETFKNDLDFIVMVANNYLKNIDKKDITYKELIILMSKCVNKIDDLNNPELSKFSLAAEGFYITENAKIILIMDCEDDQVFKRKFGMGFMNILEEYGMSNIIMEFFAKKFIYQIFYENETYTLEETIHNEFSSFENLEKKGINNYLISYIGRFDTFLAAYITCHLELLDNIKFQLNRIKKNWNDYINKINQRKVDMFNYEITQYFRKHEFQLSFNEIQLITYVIKKLHIEELFLKYDRFDYDSEYGSIFDYPCEPIDETNINLMDFKCLKYAIDLGKEIFNKDVITVEFNDYDEKTEQGPAKVIRFDFNNRKLI